MSTGTAITWEEFVAAGQEGQRWEWIDGEIHVMSPVSFGHEESLAALIAYLAVYCRTHPAWTCFASNCVFTMKSGSWRMPDASLVRKNRFESGRRPVKADFPPDVAFEIISPGNTAREIQSKRRDYLDSGSSRCGSILRTISLNWFNRTGRRRSSIRKKRWSLTVCLNLAWNCGIAVLIVGRDTRTERDTAESLLRGKPPGLPTRARGRLDLTSSA